MNVDAVNIGAAKHTIFGWFAGLAYSNWFASQPPHISLWVHVALVIVGMFATSIVIGGGMAVLAGAFDKSDDGLLQGSIHAYAWAACISPVLAFFAGIYAIKLLA